MDVVEGADVEEVDDELVDDDEDVEAVVLVVLVGAGAQDGAVPRSIVASTSRGSRGSPIADPVSTRNSSD